MRLHRKAFTHRRLLYMRSFYTQHAFTQKSFYTQQAFTCFYAQTACTHSKLLHREAFTHSKLHTQQAFTHRKLLHTASVHTANHSNRLHRETFTYSSFLNGEAFYTASFYAEKPLETDALTHSSFYTEKLLHTEALTHRTFYVVVCARHFQYYFALQNLHKVYTSRYYFVLENLDKALPSSTLYYNACRKYLAAQSQLQSLHKVLPIATLYHKTCTTASHTSCPSSPAAATLPEKTQCFALRPPPQNKPHATFMRPLQCVLQHHVANPHVSTHMATEHDNNHAAITLRSATTDSKTALTYARMNNRTLQNTLEEPITR